MTLNIQSSGEQLRAPIGITNRRTTSVKSHNVKCIVIKYCKSSTKIQLQEDQISDFKTKKSEEELIYIKILISSSKKKKKITGIGEIIIKIIYKEHK